MSQQPHGCEEYRRLSRRQFLGRAALTAGVLGAAPWMPRVVRAQGAGGPPRDVLVYIFLRGGIDSLSVVVPYGDGELYVQRPTLAVGPPGPGGALDLDGFFGLNPVAAPLLPAFAAGRLAFVHALGTNDHTRSHFDAFKKVEQGVPGQPLGIVHDGWLARHLQLVPPLASGPLRGAALRSTLPITLTGAPRTLPVSVPAEFIFPGAQATKAARKAAIAAMYGPGPAPIGPAAIDTLGSIELLGGIDFDAPPQHGASYPDTIFGRALQACATIVRADVGVEALQVDLDGFDHHNEEGPLDGDLALLLDELSHSLAAFDQDLGTLMDGVTLVAHSEFGRRVEENASLGADHGFAGMAFVLGGHVNGGQVHGTWPGLTPAAQVDGDLAVTTDLRDVLGEVLAKRLAATDLATIFPGHVVQFPGVVF